MSARIHGGSQATAPAGVAPPELPAGGGRDRPLLWVFGAAAAGIISDQFLAVPLLLWCLLLVCLVPSALWGIVRRHTCSSFLLLTAVAVLAGLWHHDRWNLYPTDEVSRRVGDAPIPVLLRVKVLDAPRHSPAARAGPFSTMTRGETTRLAVRALAIRRASQWHRASGRLALILEGRLATDGALRGDELQVAALLVRVRGPLNPGEPDFAAMCRSRRQRAILLCEHTDGIRRLSRGGPGSLLRLLGRWRLAAEAALDRHVGPQRSPLAAALVLGTRERLDHDTVQTFFVSGTLHLLAISGLHVGILAAVFWLLFRTHWLPRRRVLLAMCLLAIGYALLTGARPPVVRAAILVVVYCLARGMGRTPNAWNSLAAAGLMTLGLRPAGLFDTGTQLSFLAVATLIAAWPRMFHRPAVDPLQRLIEQSRPAWIRAFSAGTRRLRELLSVSAFVWVVSLPLVAYRFHLMAPVGLALNVLLWLPVAGAMLSGLLTILTSPLPIAPDLFGWLCDMMLYVIESLTSHGARLPWGHSWVAGPTWWAVVAFYAAMAVGQFSPLRMARRWQIALLCCWLTVVIATGSCSRRAWRAVTQPPLRLSFVALGHGTSVLVELPGGQVLLYDAGRMGSPQAAALPISSVLWSRRVCHIDALVLSHADADHFNATAELLDRFSVGVVYVSPVMFRGRAAALESLQHAIDAAHVPIGYLHEGMQLSTGGEITVQVLHPPPGGCTPAGTRGDNGNSMVVQLTCGRHRVLLTGDVENQGLDELLADEPVHCQVLMAPHHGSRSSRPTEMVRWSTPHVVVISAGASLPIDQVGPAYADGGATVLWTHRDGMIEVIMDGRDVRVSTWR